MRSNTSNQTDGFYIFLFLQNARGVLQSAQFVRSRFAGFRDWTCSSCVEFLFGYRRINQLSDFTLRWFPIVSVVFLSIQLYFRNKGIVIWNDVPCGHDKNVDTRRTRLGNCVYTEELFVRFHSSDTKHIGEHHRPMETVRYRTDENVAPRSPKIHRVTFKTQDGRVCSTRVFRPRLKTSKLTTSFSYFGHRNEIIGFLRECARKHSVAKYRAARGQQAVAPVFSNRPLRV